MAFTKLLLSTAFALLSTIFAISFAQDAPKTEQDQGPVIGIDLGTTYSCVGVMESGQVEIIPNDQGNRITPSYVSFSTDKERLIGDAAKNQAANNPTNTVFDVKRLIGRRYQEPTVQRDKKLLPFAIVSKDDKPHIQVSVGEEEKMYAPEEISAMVLGKLKKTAEDYLGRKVKRAVVTVPAYFNDAQRQATKDAGRIAGLDVLRIINEPTAAALAYGLDKKGEKNILVFDLGGGTFDVTLLTIDNGVFEVLATNGDTHLGGEDFDQRLMEYFSNLWKRKNKNSDFSKDKRALGKLRREVEKAKRELSSKTQVRLEIESFYDGKDLSESLTRARFEQLNEDLFKKTLKPVAKVLKDSGIDKNDVQEIVLVGGSTRIPKIREMVKSFFDDRAPHTEINPDEAIAYGATVQAAILSGDKTIMNKNLVLLDVLPLSLGIETLGGVMSRVVKRNTVVPTKKSEPFTTTVDNQRTLQVSVYEGERALVKDCHLLGEFELKGINPAPKGHPQIMVTFDIDESGIVKVTAEDKASKVKGDIEITNRNSAGLSQEEIDRMVKEAEDYRDDDIAVGAKVKARNELEEYLTSLAANIAKAGSDLSSSDKKDLETAMEDAGSWLKSADLEKADVDEIDGKRKDLEELAMPLLGSGAGYTKDEL